MVLGEAEAGSRPASRAHRAWAKVPLRVRLVAAALALVAFAMIVIGAGSVFALRFYLIDRVDSQLTVATRATVESLRRSAQPSKTQFFPPSDFFVAIKTGEEVYIGYYEASYQQRDLPDPQAAIDRSAHFEGRPFTMHSQDGRRNWRLMVTSLPNQSTMLIGEDLSGVESAMDRLLFVNLLVGVAVLVMLAAVGVWMVRMSLRPLVAIERTAAAIAGGDLTRRVPELDTRTELGQLSASLNTMLTQIEAAFRSQAASERRAVRSEERMREFVADASHELRTPLTTIRGFAELFRQGAATDPAAVLRRIEDEAARMGLLVEDLLLLARLDQERPLRRAPVELAALIADAAAAASAMAPEREISVEIAESGQPLIVDGDEARLRQVIGNLVTNALTHTPGDTAVTLRLAPDGDAHARVSVADAGPGLAPDQTQRVFERFYRVDKARTRRAASGASAGGAAASAHSGAGLGLAIVVALVAAHGGTVGVESTPGVGATFWVRLPLQSDKADSQQTSR